MRTACKAIVAVSTDEWVVVKKDSGAWLYTQDLIGCVAVVVEARDHVALAHVLDRDKPSGDESKAAAALDGIVAVLGKDNITGATLLLASDRETLTYKLARTWVKKYVEDPQLIGNTKCLMISPLLEVGRKIKDDERRLLVNPVTGAKWVTRWGKLPQWRTNVGVTTGKKMYRIDVKAELQKVPDELRASLNRSPQDIEVTFLGDKTTVDATHWAWEKEQVIRVESEEDLVALYAQSGKRGLMVAFQNPAFSMRATNVTAA